MPQALFGHATLGAVLRYWEKKRGKRRMPARRDIDPIEMDRRVLPQLMLCEVSAHGNLVRFRLVGTSLAKISSVISEPRHYSSRIATEK